MISVGMLVVDCKFKICLEVFQNKLWDHSYRKRVSDQVYHNILFWIFLFHLQRCCELFVSDPKTDIVCSILAESAFTCPNQLFHATCYPWLIGQCFSFKLLKYITPMYPFVCF